MFTNKVFTLIEFSVDFATKRLLVIKNLIIQNKGEILEKDKINKNKIPNYIITSKNCKYFTEIFKNLSEEKDLELIKKLINIVYEYEYISDCVKHRKLLDESLYRINLSKEYIKKRSNIPKEDYCAKERNYLIDDIDFWKNDDLNKVFPSTQNCEINWSNFNINSNPFESKTKDQLFEELQNEVVIKGKNECHDDDNSIICYDDYEEEEDEENISTISSNTSINLISNTLNVNINNCINTNENININKNISQSLPKLQSMNFQNKNNDNKNKYKKGFGFAFADTNKNNVNHNKNITDELEKILNFHTTEGNVFEALAYRKAIGIIKKYPKKIEEITEIKKLKFIGQKIGEKIKEIILTGKTNRGEYINNDKKTKAINELCKVHGIGIIQAKEYYRKGITSVNDLKKIKNELPQVVQKGLTYFDDLQIKIPREEITEIFQEIKIELFKILPEKIIDIMVCGSYRRGKKLCGDMDVLITRKDDGQIDGILSTLVEKLMEKNIIVEMLTFTNKNIEKNNKYVFMGIYKGKNNIFRRIDIKVYHKTEYPFAVLYFTGSAYFNRSMRLFARKNQMHLSDKELSYRNSGKKIICKTEEDIFQALGIEYKTPEQRDI